MQETSSVFPITFEIPSNPEPVAAVHLWALSLRGLAPRAGGHYEVSTDVDRVTAIRVQVPKGIPEELDVFQSALELLCAVDLWCLRNYRLLGHAPFPQLYESLCYLDKVPSADENEVWDSSEALYRRGHGICEDLACHRIAERRLVGDACRPLLVPYEQVDGTLFHVVIQNPDRSIEDPSLALGMALGKSDDPTSPGCKAFLRQREIGR